jgi:hypothetical protein
MNKYTRSAPNEQCACANTNIRQKNVIECSSASFSIILKMTWICHITDHYICSMYFSLITHGYFQFQCTGLWGCEDRKPSTVRLNPFLRGRPHTSRARSDQSQLIRSSCAYFSRTLIGQKLLFTWTWLIIIASRRMQPIGSQSVAAVRWCVRIFINY